MKAPPENGEVVAAPVALTRFVHNLQLAPRMTRERDGGEAICKGIGSAGVPAVAVAPAKPAPNAVAAAPIARAAPAARTAPATAQNTNPVGATGQCRDGTYTHAKTHTGACSRHGGVVKWL